jgi:hypothetical protein
MGVPQNLRHSNYLVACAGTEPDNDTIDSPGDVARHADLGYSLLQVGVADTHGVAEYTVGNERWVVSQLTLEPRHPQHLLGTIWASRGQHES